jgi:hypothetical protein
MPNLFPTQERETYIIREAVPGTAPATIGVPIPVLTMKPSDKPMMLPDESMQGHMGDNSGIYQGPLIAGYDIGGHLTTDIIGHFLYNVLGDYTTVGTPAAPNTTASAPIAAGATSITVASGGASYTTGMNLWIEDGGSPAANEVVTVSAGSTATNIPLSTPTRFAHLTATPFTNTTTASYTHTFSLLNGLIGAGPNGAAQPWTHCITDRTGIPLTGLAAQYTYGCLSDLTITGNAEKLLDWSGKVICQPRTIPGSPVTPFTAVSGVQPYPAWRSTTALGAPVATLTKDVAEWSVTWTRAVKPYNTTQGSQLPFAIGRGKLTTTGKLVISPAIDESALVALLANAQPQLEFVATNSATSGITIDIGLGAYETADLNEGSELFGYDVPFKAAGTNASFTCTPFTGPLTGASGGKSASKITLISVTPTF